MTLTLFCIIHQTVVHQTVVQGMGFKIALAYDAWGLRLYLQKLSEVGEQVHGELGVFVVSVVPRHDVKEHGDVASDVRRQLQQRPAPHVRYLAAVRHT